MQTKSCRIPSAINADPDKVSLDPDKVSLDLDLAALFIYSI
jgi:hypothetical protein